MQVVVISGPDQGRKFPLVDGQTLHIGRGQESETQLTDPHASRTHCQIEVDGNQIVVIDNGSAAGTLVNNENVTRKELQPGDVIRVGQTEFRFELDDSTATTTVVTTGEADSRPKPMSHDNVRSLIGTVIHHYHIEKELAQGTTGLIFLAKHTETDRPLALKVLWPEISQNEEEMQRFIRAMKTMLPIQHPNIIRIYNAGKTGKNCWVAMEYVEGESLTQVIERIGTAGMLDWRTAFQVAVHIARALEAAFEQQIIHRNITPQNIMLRTSDKVSKLGDLMLAKAMEGTQAEQITQPGQLIGDLAYMSPERTRGASDADCRSDIYSLGATVYALLTGRPPFEGHSLPELISKIRQEEPVKPKQFQLSIADLFEGAVLRMLAKRSEDRYQTPTDLLTDLERIGKFQGMTI